MNNLHKELLAKNDLYKRWHNNNLHPIFHWVLLFFVAITVTNGLLVVINTQSISAETTGVQYTFDSLGLQSLTYNGISYMTPIATDANQMTVPGVLFVTPEGIQKPYGWLANSLDQNLNIGTSVRTTGTNPDFTQQIYRPGKSDSFTLRWTYSKPDTNTLKMDLAVTNNDASSTIKQITSEYFMWLKTPGQILKELPYVGSNLAMGSKPNTNYGSGWPTTYLQGDWGSMVLFTDKYDQNWSFFSATFREDATTHETSFLPAIRNFSQSGQSGSSLNTLIDPIPPGQTAHYTLYIRFGSSGQTAYDLAPEAYSAFRTAVPNLVNWPDRRPLAYWFIGDGASNSTTNPRSYLWDPNLDVVPLTPAKQANFSSKILTLTDNIITRMNSWNPKPQGVMIWDLEGDEFKQYFTYVGSPNKLYDLAPEMGNMDTLNAAGTTVADKMFAKFAAAGYKVGITLRPSTFGIGPVLPATCESHPTNVDVRDVFIKTDSLSLYPNRGYECTATNVWTQVGARNPYHQRGYDIDKILLDELRTKITYARNRWGVKLFYIDSTVYNSNGPSYTYLITQQLQREFPDTLLIPENETWPDYSASAPYNQSDMGTFDTNQEIRNLYPGAFGVINSGGVDMSPTSPNYTKLVQAVKNGNILLGLYAWFDATSNAQMLQIYRDAGFGNGSTTTPPVVPPPAPSTPLTSITSPLAGSISGTVSITATASDTAGVTKVELYKDGSLLNSSTVLPYTYPWNTTSDSNGNHTLQTKAYNAAGNVGVSTIVTVTVNNIVADTQAPTVPTNLTAVAPDSTKVNLSWTASTDNTGVTGYNVNRNGTLLTSVSTNSFSDVTVAPATTYSYTIQAFDAANNTSSNSNPAVVTVPSNSTTTQPAKLTIVNSSVSQITATAATLSWSTNLSATGLVSYGTTNSNLSKTSSDPNSLTSHSVTMSALQKNTRYYYQITSTDPLTGETVKSAVLNFKTKPR